MPEVTNNTVKEHNRVRVVSNDSELLRRDGTFINEADLIYKGTDAFDKPVSKSFKNSADLASHYNYSPERHRLYINGTREHLQYAPSSKFEDKPDVYTLKPAGGDVMTFRTSERFRYVVNYVLEASSAFGANQLLQGNDKIVVGYGEPDLENDMANADGWFWEFEQSEDGKTCKLTSYRLGVETSSVTIDDLPKAINEWLRVQDDINWYNVGIREATMTYTINGTQFNTIVGSNSTDNGRATSRANYNYVFAVRADASTTGLELDIGSVGINIIGDVDPIFRVKDTFLITQHSGSGLWEPLFAVQRDPNNDNVFVNLSDVEILELSADVDFDLVVIGVDPSKTDATGWQVPSLHSATNSAVRETSNITTFPDPSGNIVTSANYFGGFQLGASYYRTAGTGTANRRTRQSRGVRRRPISNGDYALFLGRCTNGSPVNVETEYETEQQY